MADKNRNRNTKPKRNQDRTASVALSRTSCHAHHVTRSLYIVFTFVSSTLISYKVRKMLASIGLRVCKLMVSLLPELKALSLIASSGFVLTPSSLNC